jgi:hypothetical protein
MFQTTDHFQIANSFSAASVHNPQDCHQRLNFPLSFPLLGAQNVQTCDLKTLLLVFYYYYWLVQASRLLQFNKLLTCWIHGAA